MELDALKIMIIIGAVVLIGIIAIIIKWYNKAIQGQALVKTGAGGIRVDFSGMMVIPVLHKLEKMDITVKTINISRKGKDGLICKDNMRADIEVAFFVRVNNKEEDVKKVATTIGCARASDLDALRIFFESKFSEALKTVGKRFDFVELYNEREKFRDEIVLITGTSLNGYVLDDVAIDYLEQTPLTSLIADNILDSEGIKKITELTATQQIKANFIQRDKEKTIKQQDVEAREVILELEKQLAEKEQIQQKEIANITDREETEIKKVSEEQRLIAERSRITSDEEIAVAEQNKERQIIVALKNKEKTEAVETELVEQERALQQTERERIVTLAQIEKEKAVEEEKKIIQEVIKQRVIVEKATVTEEEKIKDTKEFAKADRDKKVNITNAEMWAEQALVKEIKAAEAKKTAATFLGEEKLINATADFDAAGKKAESIKILADAKAAEEAALGISEAQVIEAKAEANLKQGQTDATVIELNALAEAKGIEAKAAANAKEIELTSTAEAGATLQVGTAEADVIKAKASAIEEQGLAEAHVMAEKFQADATGIEQKADAMKKLDGVGKDHEEFKLHLDKEKQIELATINIQKDIADAQAMVIAEALKVAKIDIVGGETMFFDKIIGSITQGKSVDRMVDNSEVIREIKDTFFDSTEGKNFKSNLKEFVDQFGISSEDMKNLSITALLLKMTQDTKNKKTHGVLNKLLDMATSLGIADKNVGELGLDK